MRRFFIALQFLTIVPVRLRGDVSEENVSRSAAFFPVVGIVQGALLVLATMLFENIFHPDLVAALVLLVLVLTNGGFHMDGLADTFDALAAKGDREKRLDVMKDGSSGAIGVTAIVFAILIKFLALRGVSGAADYFYYGTLLLLPVFSKWAMLLLMLTGKPAREDGLGRVFIQGIRGADVAAATFMVLVLAAIPAFLWCNWAYLLSMGFILILCFLLLRLFMGKFGGLTGDTMGAAGELAELIFLLTVNGWQRLYI